MRNARLTPAQGKLPTVARLARQFALPIDFFTGRPEDPPLLPTNILCFTKTSARALVEHSQRVRRHHQRHVLLFALEGEGVICVDGREHRLSAGKSLFILPFELHHYVHFRQEKVTWFYVTFDLPHDPRMTRFRQAGPLTMQREDLVALQSVQEAWLGDHCATLLPVTTALLLTRLSLHIRKPPSGTLPLYKRQHFMQQINEVILARKFRGIGSRQLAMELGISSSLLRNWFREETGIPLARHLQELRLQKASALLSEENRRITEVAEACGFESVYSFSRAFKKARGLSPTAYRQRLAEKGGQAKDPGSARL